MCRTAISTHMRKPHTILDHTVKAWILEREWCFFVETDKNENVLFSLIYYRLFTMLNAVPPGSTI